MITKGLKYVFMLAMLMSASLSFAQAKDDYHTGKLESFNLSSNKFQFDRKIFVNLPTGYDENNATDYDVIYVFDAQDLSYLEMVSSYPKFINTSWADRFIVVGICSPNTLSYNRLDDFLPNDPETVKAYKGHGGRAENLAKFVKDELQPYIKSHYRTTDRSIGVGHALGATFLMGALLDNKPFDAYFMFSPDLSVGDFMYPKRFKEHDFSEVKQFIFLTDAAEESTPGMENWGVAREMIYGYLDEHVMPRALKWNKVSYSGYNHMSAFPLALKDAYSRYFNYRDSLDNILSKETYHKRIEIEVNNPNDEVYITGNQNSLGKWNPGKIKMEKVSDRVRAIEVDVQLPAQIKFTRGSWKSEAYFLNTPDGTNVRIDNKTKEVYKYKLHKWSDE